MASMLSDIKAVILRAQFLATLAMFLTVALMVVQDSIAMRAFLLLPVVFFYYLSKILFAREQQERVDRIIAKIKAEQQ
jgi:hypothetical protein